MNQSELRALPAGCECQEKIAWNQRWDGFRLKSVIEWIKYSNRLCPAVVNCR